MNIDNNLLRAWAGLILLVLALFSTYLKYESQTMGYTIIALVGFLVGGALLNNNKQE